MSETVIETKQVETKQVLLRNVPERVHRLAKAAAALYKMSLEQYIVKAIDTANRKAAKESVGGNGGNGENGGGEQ